ncbi:MAG: histidinol-phosphatase [Pyrinomonadaceae bacterium MAG19_C2-C3]|nr:histidinol-phosphatase [Pyrinomonadaceae bacterium MAG19_C2-C3]
MTNHDLQSTLDFAISMAREAGNLTLEYFRRGRGSLVVKRKSDDSFVTNADREAEAFMRCEIERRFPDDAILGEEAGESDGTSGRRWILDPIDGTYSFVHGVPLYGVLVGLEIEGEPALGVVNLPATDEVVYARRGGGCFWNNEKVTVSNTPHLKDALILSTDFGTCAQYGFGEACDELARTAKTRRTWGDAYGHILVATGRADVMFDPVMNVWDCAALLPIIKEAGGTFTDWAGKTTIYGGNAIATNGALFDEVMHVVSKCAAK